MEEQDSEKKPRYTLFYEKKVENGNEKVSNQKTLKLVDKLTEEEWSGDLLDLVENAVRSREDGEVLKPGDIVTVNGEKIFKNIEKYPVPNASMEIFVSHYNTLIKKRSIIDEED